MAELFLTDVSFEIENRSLWHEELFLPTVKCVTMHKG